MLGVATMIVVNSVMAGFADKMHDRLHGVLADVVVESFTLNGFYDWKEVMARIEQVAGKDMLAMAPTMECPGILHFRVNGEVLTRPVQLIGIIPEERARTGDFAEFLFDARAEPISPSFDVPEAYKEQTPAGQMLQESKFDPNNEFDKRMQEELKQEMDEQAPDRGVILGYALATYHRKGHEDIFIAPPGTTGRPALPPLRQDEVGGRLRDVHHHRLLQERHERVRLDPRLRAAGSPQQARFLYDFDRQVGAVNQIQIKVRPGVDIDKLSRRIQVVLDKMRPMFYQVQTWEQKQGPLLGAVAVEQSILNILLFFIIAVAGFGILAIFSMIVVEKTRDIGILKALGASTPGSAASSWATGCCWGPSAAASGWSAACCSSATSTRSSRPSAGRPAARSSTTRSTTSTRSRPSSSRSPWAGSWPVRS